MRSLDRVHSNAIMWTAGVSVNLGQEGEAALAIAHAELAALTAELRQLTVERGKDVDLIYMNYADPSQIHWAATERIMWHSSRRLQKSTTLKASGSREHRGRLQDFESGWSELTRSFRG